MLSYHLNIVTLISKASLDIEQDLGKACWFQIHQLNPIGSEMTSPQKQVSTWRKVIYVHLFTNGEIEFSKGFRIYGQKNWKNCTGEVVFRYQKAHVWSKQRIFLR